MNKIFIVFFFILASLSASAQQFSLYNTGTLYDSFENPSQRAFIPDSSREIASNFFVPNFNANFFVTGNSQTPLKTRVFATPGFYNTGPLLIGKGAINHFNANANAYALMVKLFTSLDGDVEIGFSAQAKVESKGIITDESVAFLNGYGDPQKFQNGTYDNIFNNHYAFQTYDQLSFTYREQVNKQLAVGFKLSALSGIQYEKIDVAESHATFDKPGDSATVAMRGRYYQSYIPGRLIARDFLPVFRNPGASITFGASFLTESGVVVQGNIKDLGFIHWSNRSYIHNFNGATTIKGLSTQTREDSIYNNIDKLFRSGGDEPQSFSTKTDAKAELSVSKSYWLDDDKNFRYFPTLVASKELFDTGFTGAWVNSVQTGNLVGTITATYDDYHFFNMGGQFMIKSPNAEFYIGSERLVTTGRLLLAAAGSNGQIDRNGTYTGADIYIGFSFKIGRVIEHPLNSSYIPMGEKGFFGRLYNRIFKTYK